MVVSSACWRAVPVAVLGRSFRLGSRLRCGRWAVLPLGGIDCGVVWMAGQPAATPSREQKDERQGRGAASALPSLAGLEQPINCNRQAPKRARLLRRHGVSRLQKAASERFNSSWLHLCGVPVSDPWSSPSRQASSPKPNAPTSPFGRRDCGAVTPRHGIYRCAMAIHSNSVSCSCSQRRRRLRFGL